MYFSLKLQTALIPEICANRANIDAMNELLVMPIEDFLYGDISGEPHAWSFIEIIFVGLGSILTFSSFRTPQKRNNCFQLLFHT